MAQAKRYKGKQYHGPEQTVVAVTSNGGTTAVVYDVAYEIPPQVMVVAPRGSAGTYSAASQTKAGFTLTIASETDTDFDEKNVTVTWFAMET